MLVSAYETVKLNALKAWARFKDNRALKGVEQKPAARFKGDRISRQTFREVKRSIKLLGVAREFYTMRDIANHHNIGRTTAYNIRNSKNFEEYQNACY